MSLRLRSPRTGQDLVPDTPHSLRDGTGERWPVIDDIAFLRTGREALAGEALARLDSGDRNGALALLLVDQDDWWPGPTADPERVAVLVRDADGLSFRAAMDHLGFGRVGDYLAHRWSDPTFLAGLALMEAHWRDPASAFELACGAGHYLRALAQRGVACVGADVVYAKLWLARHWVCGPRVDLVCFDAGSLWPIDDGRADLVLCHDALYFLEPKAEIVGRLRAMTAADGVLAVAHVHNREAANLSAGQGVVATNLAALFPTATAYDDAELTAALAAARPPRPLLWEDLRRVEAFSLVEGSIALPRAVERGLALPPTGTSLVRNPIYGADETVAWPSVRYREEYASRATYPARSAAPSQATCGPAVEAMARRRELVDLPERW